MSSQINCDIQNWCNRIEMLILTPQMPVAPWSKVSTFPRLPLWNQRRLNKGSLILYYNTCPWLFAPLLFLWLCALPLFVCVAHSVFLWLLFLLSAVLTVTHSGLISVFPSPSLSLSTQIWAQNIYLNTSHDFHFYSMTVIIITLKK